MQSEDKKVTFEPEIIDEEHLERILGASHDNLLDMNEAQLQFLLDECDSALKVLREALIKEYRRIKPILTQLSIWKETIEKINRARETYVNFLSISDPNLYSDNISDLCEYINFRISKKEKKTRSRSEERNIKISPRTIYKPQSQRVNLSNSQDSIKLKKSKSINTTKTKK